MRLLQLGDNGELSLTHDFIQDIPPYAILSHTWGRDSEEVTLQDVEIGRGNDKEGYKKILFCGEQAKRDGLEYFWVDTCCIDKTSSAELTEAINSMFGWYRNAVHCYVYLPDVLVGSSADNQVRQTDQALRIWDSQFRKSKWFTRGWTLQELLAPASVKFFSAERVFLGDKMSLEVAIYAVTNIKISALRGDPLDRFSVAERMNWSSSRRTKRAEDAAYCLLGIFSVNIPVIYGEGKTNAINRLLKTIEDGTGISHALPQTQLSFLPMATKMTDEVHFLVPFGQNDEFVGRRTILADVVDKALPDANRNDCQRTVLEGLGGVGKTQIALEAAYRVYKQGAGCSVFWVPAITMITFENAYREIGEALGTPGMDDKKADVKTLVKTALERSGMKWLLIIDNIDDIALLNEGGLQDNLPFNRKGSILFTTRNHEVAVWLDVSKKHTLVVDEMCEEEATELLRNGLQERQYRDAQGTRELVQHLVCLPLAIKQASAYMAQTRITITKYLQLCLKSDDAQLKLLNTDFEERRRYTRETNPITVTWLISFQHLAQSCPLAVEYLKLTCFLAEKDVPISLLPCQKQEGQADDDNENLEDEQAQDEAIGILAGYAFITVRESGESFDIHRLVRLVTRNWIKDDWETCCTKAIRQLGKVYPFPEHENRQMWMRYMPHAEIALQMRNKCTDKEAAVKLLFNVAESCMQVAKYEKAEDTHRQALELKKLVLGIEHQSTLNSMNNLANVLNSLGRYEEAEQMHRQALNLNKSVLGLEHPLTLGSMNNLALVFDSLGRYEEAELMHRQALELKKSVLGLEHPSTLGSMNNLANVLNTLGRYEEAEQMHRQALNLNKSVLGLEHPSTLDSMNNLANVLDRLGRYEEAEQIHRQALNLNKSVLGLEHLSTLGSMNNLANVLDSLGRYEEAELMHRQALNLKKSVLGLEHPSTLDSMNNLAFVLNRLGRYEDAEQMHRQTLELRKSVLGSQHPSTTQSRGNLQHLLDFLEDKNQTCSEASSEESESEGGVVL